MPTYGIMRAGWSLRIEITEGRGMKKKEIVFVDISHCHGGGVVATQFHGWIECDGYAEATPLSWSWIHHTMRVSGCPSFPSHECGLSLSSYSASYCEEHPELLRGVENIAACIPLEAQVARLAGKSAVCVFHEGCKSPKEISVFPAEAALRDEAVETAAPQLAELQREYQCRHFGCRMEVMPPVHVMAVDPEGIDFTLTPNDEAQMSEFFIVSGLPFVYPTKLGL